MSVALAPSVPRRLSAFGRDLQMPVIAALAYYAGAQAAFLVGTLSDKIFAPLWPPNVVLFCALLLSSPQRWGLFIAAAFPAHVAAELGVGMYPLQLLVAFATNCAVAIINAVGVKHFLGDPPWFGSIRKACIYVLIAALAGPMVAALGGAFVPLMSSGSVAGYWDSWAFWYLSNAVGSVTLAPIIMILLSAPRNRLRSQFTIRSSIEILLLGLALGTVCAVAFQIRAVDLPTAFLPTLLYLPLPFVLWGVIRFGALGAASTVLLVAVVLIWRALNEPNLFLTGTPETSVLAIQAFLIGFSIPVILLGASIEETRHAERATRESEERMALAAASADVCMWQTDGRGAPFWITGYGRTMLGLPPHAPVTRDTVIGLVHPDDRQHAKETLLAAASANRLADCEFRIVRPDGMIRWLRCRARPSGRRGNVERISGTFADITEAKSAEFALAQQRQEISHLMRVSMLSELSVGLAHELTQPMTAILSNAEAALLLLQNNPPQIAEAIDAIKDIIEEDSRAGEVIHRMRGLLKKSEANFEPVDLSEIIHSTLRLVHNELITRRVRVKSSLQPQLPLVLGDPVQVQQVMLNLILNAFDAMNEVTPSRRIVSVAAKVSGEDEIAVEIADTGAGLLQSHQDRLFQPFFTTKERGLGLGLSLCATILKAHGGSLSLVSNPAGGAIASFSLPILKVQDAMSQV
jgi:PAS domain S-box-containing protein